MHDTNFMQKKPVGIFVLWIPKKIHVEIVAQTKICLGYCVFINSKKKMKRIAQKRVGLFIL